MRIPPGIAVAAVMLLAAILLSSLVGASVYVIMLAPLVSVRD